MENIQGRITITMSIPEEYKTDPELAYNYVREISEKLAELKLIKEVNNPMIIAEVDEVDEPFLDDKEYYIDYYDAIFPE